MRRDKIDKDVSLTSLAAASAGLTFGASLTRPDGPDRASRKYWIDISTILCHYLWATRKRPYRSLLPKLWKAECFGQHRSRVCIWSRRIYNR